MGDEAESFSEAFFQALPHFTADVAVLVIDGGQSLLSYPMRSFPLFAKLLLLAGLFSTTGVYAQDNIILKNGSEIQAKVLEISPGQIKYRRQDNPDGPIYTTGTADVLLIKYANGTKDVLSQPASRLPGTSLAPLQSVPSSSPGPGAGRLDYHRGFFSRYFTNGAGERIAPSETRLLLGTYQDAMTAYRRGQSLRRWSYVTAGAAVALVGTGATIALLGDNHRTNSSTNNDGRAGRRDRESTEVGIALAGGGVLLGVTSLFLHHRTTIQFRRATDRYNLHQQPATSLRFGPSQRGLGVSTVYTF